MQIDKSIIIGQLIGLNDGIPPILMASGMHCLGCPSSQNESLEEACQVHGIDVDELVDRINLYLTLI